MVDAPGCHLRVTPADADQIRAPHDLSARILEWTNRYRERCSVEHRPLSCLIEVTQAIPSHAGFGSGTQTALALAAALANFSGEREVPAIELARRVGRGLRSALGIHGFGRGGFLVEAGKQDIDEISPLISRLDVPTDWRWLLITPRDSRGLSGESERSAFAKLGPMPATMTDRLCRISLMELIPAMQIGDFEAVSESLFEFGRLNGEYFAPIQGGLFADPQMNDLVEHLRSNGCRGVGQTSWGPTLFALCRHENDAAERYRELSHIANLFNDGSLSHFDHHIARPRNVPASISVE
jgi:beta-RFAP synthase